MVGIFVIMRWLTCSVVLFYNSVLRSSVNLHFLTSYLTLSSGHLGRNLWQKLQIQHLLTLCLPWWGKSFITSSAGLGYWVGGKLHWCCAKYIKWIPYLNPTTIFSGMNFLFLFNMKKAAFPWSHSSKTYPIIFSPVNLEVHVVGIFWGSH